MPPRFWVLLQSFPGADCDVLGVLNFAPNSPTILNVLTIPRPKKQALSP